MSELIGLEEAKLHCRIDDDYEDTLIQAYIEAALDAQGRSADLRQWLRDGAQQNDMQGNGQAAAGRQ